ncbi:MAG: dihydroorotate dehydrogenase electron transfer subunit [Armatimonadetes bacterium]|nr:dihydroorotate dehydrogenase electron transfer subunit [Armatimonadota bacterium]
MPDKVGVSARRWQLPVLANDPAGRHYRELLLEAPELAALLRPGQFVNVLCAEGNDPFLRRPLSVAGIDRSAGTISLLYEVIGRGTRLMAEWEPGDLADLLGPLGNWFPLPDGEGPLALVAGGIGVAPLLALAAEVAPSGRPLHVLLGARTAELLLGERAFADLGVTLAVATDDGSRGYHGFVSGLLESELQAHGRQFDAAFVCGPRPMMAAVSAVAQRAGIPCFVSMEVGMACGFGVCMGCAWRVRTLGSEPVYRLVCTDGPIFNAAEILWEPPQAVPTAGCGEPAPAREEGCNG